MGVEGRGLLREGDDGPIARRMLHLALERPPCVQTRGQDTMRTQQTGAGHGEGRDGGNVCNANAIMVAGLRLEGLAQQRPATGAAGMGPLQLYLDRECPSKSEAPVGMKPAPVWAVDWLVATGP